MLGATAGEAGEGRAEELTSTRSTRLALLTAALVFSAVQWREPVPPVAIALTSWLDNWRGIGAVVGGMRWLG